MKGKTAINGDATEDEKISIKTELDDEKLEIKEEPGTTGNGNLEPVCSTHCWGSLRNLYFRSYRVSVPIFRRCEVALEGGKIEANWT